MREPEQVHGVALVAAWLALIVGSWLLFMGAIWGISSWVLYLWSRWHGA